MTRTANRSAVYSVAFRPPVGRPTEDSRFKYAISRQVIPKYLSSDNDPLFLYHQWQANLRILDVEEFKTVPFVPISHPLVERLIGTLRREYLDRLFFWNEVDLRRKLDEFKVYYNEHRTHASLSGSRPAERAGRPVPAPIALNDYRWESRCRGLFELPVAA